MKIAETKSKCLHTG